MFQSCFVPAAYSQAAATITADPANQSALLGSNAFFSVSASGQSPLAYRWFFNGAPLADGARIAGSTTPALAITGVVEGDAGGYYAVVSNRHGMDTSLVATLTVLVPPSVDFPSTNRVALAGTAVSFAAQANGTPPLYYSWQKNGLPLANGGRISGATSSVLSITAAEQADSGQYRVVVSNAYGMVTSAVATLNVGIPLPGISSPTSAWGDYDNDGRMDVLLAGATMASRFTRLYHNIGGVFQEVPVSFPQVAVASAAWGDYDNDGDLDLALSGESSSSGLQAHTLIYRNDGNGVFTNIQAGLDLQSNAAIRWVDYDNDGRLDAHLSRAGYLWRNRGNGTFEQGPYVGGAYPGLAEWGDYDNDGDKDAVIAASLQFNGMPPRVMVNNSESGFGSAGLNEIAPTYAQDFFWGDYDNDGDQDLLTSDYHFQNPIRVFKRGGDGSFTVTNENVRPFQSLMGRWADFDNDGKLDMLTMEHLSQQDLIQVYCDTGTNYDHVIWFSGLWAGTAAFVDIDQDSDLDVYYTGKFSSTANFMVTGYLTNHTGVKNSSPSPPSGLSHELLATNNGVILRWLAATDAQTPPAGLNYNLRVGTTPGGVEIMSPASDLTTGRRQVLEQGNAGPATFWILRDLPAGTYHWSVQAIDTAFAGSAFAAGEGVFQITNTRPLISNIPDQKTEAQVPTQPIAFSVSDAETPASDLQLTGFTSNEAVVPGTNIVFSGEGTNRSVVITPAPAKAGSAVITVQVMDAAGALRSDQFMLTVTSAPPRIVAQPVSQVATVGVSVISLSVSTTGSQPQFFQWKKDGLNLSDTAFRSGTTTSNLVLSPVILGDAGSYSVSVTSPYGSTNSLSANLTVRVPAAFGDNPENHTVPAGGTGSFYAGAYGDFPIWYQWRFNGTNLPGKISFTLSIPNAQAWNQGGYDLVASNLYGVSTSSVATLTVTPSLPLITTNPVSTVASVGQNAVLTVAAKGSEPIFCQWQKEGADLPGATGLALTLSNVNSSFRGLYRAVVTNVVGNALSAEVRLDIVPLIAWGSTRGITNIPASASNIVAIAASRALKSSAQCLALRDDGTLIQWPTFVSPPANATNIVAISKGGSTQAGADNDLALQEDGMVLHWRGQSQFIAPATLATNNVVSLAAGASHQLALLGNGNVVAWSASGGANAATNVPPEATNVVAIAAGQNVSFALRMDGRVVAWGATNTPSLITNATAIAAGSDQWLALLADRSVGGSIILYNNPGAAPSRGSPPQNWTNITALAAGAYHSLALGADGTVAGIGATNYGEPFVPEYLSNVLAIAAGAQDNLVLVRDPFAPPILPRIGRPPLSRTVTCGQSMVINALALGGLPLTYQWLKGGVPVADQTQQYLALADVNPGHAGDYQLMAMNEFGAVTSAVATLTVELPRPALLAPSIVTNAFRFSFNSVRGLIYITEYRDSLSEADWMELERRFGSGSIETIIDPSPASGKRLYRVLAIYVPSPSLNSTSIAGAKMQFGLNTVEGATYVIEFKDSLDSENWIELSRHPGTGAPIQIADPVSPAGNRFYRVRVE